MSPETSDSNTPDRHPGSNNDQNGTTGNDGSGDLAWTCHPVKRRPLVSILVTVFIFVVVWAVHQTTDSRTFAILAMAVMLGSLAKFYFPTKYRFSDERIMIKTTTQTLYKKWSQFRSCYPDKNGILLSPFSHPTRLENFRGIYIMFSGNAEEVTEFARRRLDAQAREAAANNSEDVTS